MEGPIFADKWRRLLDPRGVPQLSDLAAWAGGTTPPPRLAHLTGVRLFPGGWEWTYGRAAGLVCGKVMGLIAGTCLEWRVHQQRYEILAVLSGTIEYWHRDGAGVNERAHVLTVGDSIRTPPGTGHRVLVRQDALVVESATA